MRLSTIWTLHGMSTAERLRQTWDWSFAAFASKLPVRLKYHVTMQEISKATLALPGDTEIPAIPLDTILSNIEAPKNWR